VFEELPVFDSELVDLKRSRSVSDDSEVSKGFGLLRDHGVMCAQRLSYQQKRSSWRQSIGIEMPVAYLR
jgi:hypothetical protein